LAVSITMLLIIVSYYYSDRPSSSTSYYDHKNYSKYTVRDNVMYHQQFSSIHFINDSNTTTSIVPTPETLTTNQSKSTTFPSTTITSYSLPYYYPVDTCITNVASDLPVLTGATSGYPNDICAFSRLITTYVDFLTRDCYYAGIPSKSPYMMNVYFTPRHFYSFLSLMKQHSNFFNYFYAFNFYTTTGTPYNYYSYGDYKCSDFGSYPWIWKPSIKLYHPVIEIDASCRNYDVRFSFSYSRITDVKDAMQLYYALYEAYPYTAPLRLHYYVCITRDTLYYDSMIVKTMLGQYTSIYLFGDPEHQIFNVGATALTSIT
jgi:hypothetical protein